MEKALFSVFFLFVDKVYFLFVIWRLPSASDTYLSYLVTCIGADVNFTVLLYGAEEGLVGGDAVAGGGGMEYRENIARGGYSYHLALARVADNFKGRVFVKLTRPIGGRIGEERVGVGLSLGIFTVMVKHLGKSDLGALGYSVCTHGMHRGCPGVDVAYYPSYGYG